jgi:protein-tyrosine phosphatase
MPCSQADNHRATGAHTGLMAAAEPVIPGTFKSRRVRSAKSPLVRSDAPVRLDATGRAAIARLGVRTAIDLREPVERELDPVDLDSLGVEVRHVPILGGEFDVHTTMSLEEIYYALLGARGDALAAAVRVLCEGDALPALVFCSAGKDRTGLVVALALAAGGVPDEEIVADYALTERAMANGFRAVLEQRAAAAGISEQEMAIKVGAPPELMRRVLDWVGSHAGGAAGYLRQHGLTDRELAALRRATGSAG